MTFKPGAFKSNLLFLFVLLGALLLCMIAALMLGDYKISIAKILDVLNLKIFDIPAAGIWSGSGRGSGDTVFRHIF